MSVVFSIRVPEGLAKELEQIAVQTERPRSFHVHKALETYVREFADLQIALDRLHDQGDPAISPHDLRDSLGL